MENNQLATTYQDQTQDYSRNYIGELVDPTQANMFTSFQADTLAQKARLANIMNGQCERLADQVNKTLWITDIFAETVETVNKATGELVRAPRIIFIDKDGMGYACMSLGIFGSLKKIMALVGTPTWSPAIPVIIKQINKETKRILSMELDIKECEKMDAGK